MYGKAGYSSFTKSVNELLSLIEASSDSLDSLFSHARDYFAIAGQHDETVSKLQKDIASMEQKKDQAGKATLKKLETDLAAANKSLRKSERLQEGGRRTRIEAVLDVCDKLLKLIVVPEKDVAQNNASKILGTILLLSPGDGRGLPHLHQRFKPLYKAVLAVLLLDRLLQTGQITNKYILQRYNQKLDYSDDTKYPAFYHEVMVPLVIAALFQDIGMQHPEARRILKGESGKLDEFRLLDAPDRLKLLQITHEQTLDYLTRGLGKVPYIGNSREERDAHDKAQEQVLIFLRTIINDAVTPKQGLGNLIKAPQIYTSVVLSSKADYDIRELPKAAILLVQIAKKGAISEGAAKAMVDILGFFPQGFGVAYIPRDQNNREMDRYEYAIVNSLYPDDPRQPVCRTVTRNQTFIAHGGDVRVSETSNLYFPVTQEKLRKVKPERLKEILSQLYHDFQQRGPGDLIPKCWQPYDYFSFQQNQNLWNKKVIKSV